MDRDLRSPPMSPASPSTWAAACSSD